MGRKCTVPDCLSEEGRYEDRGVTFHKIPLHSDIRPKWMSLCHIPEDKHSVKVVHVCSRHFLKADFCRFKGKKYMLKQGVLPSVFPWTKLKKEIPVDDNIAIKKEVDPGENATPNMEEYIGDKMNEDTMMMETELKQEIKEEPSDLIQETVEIKDEALSPNPADSFILLPAPCDADASAAAKKPAPSQKSSTTIEQRGKSIQTSSGILNFAINTRLEALDFNQQWFPARIIEVDYEENEVLIHFEKYSSKYDEWISMNSSRLRPLQPVAKKIFTETFAVGEKCMASWSDSRKFPASVTKVIDKDTYEVLFNDGFVKVLKSHRMAKTHGKSVGSAPLFDPVTGTKQDRRDKKRKINVAELFRKRVRPDAPEDPASAAASAPTVGPEEAPFNPTEDPESWMPRWENGRPIGVDSVIETSDGIRKSVIVADPRLPPTWQKHLTQRIHGASAGKWDTLIVSPEGRRFRTRAEIKSFLEENPQLNYNEGMFDFSLHRRTRAVRRPPQATEAPVVNTPPEPVVEEEENPNSLKIPLVDDAYQCPIEGCGKNFRRENLAQMHVKHYHPKYTKYLDSTPNVADLAYARTVGESLDKSPERTAKTTPARQVQKTVTPKTATPRVNVQSPSVEAEMKMLQSVESHANQLQLQKTKDSEILKLLNSKPPEEHSPKYPPGLPPNMYPDIKLKDLLNKSEGIPKREDLNLKSLSASTTRPTGIKTLLPVVRPSEFKKEPRPEENQYADQDVWFKSASRSHAYKQSLKRKRLVSENFEPLKPEATASFATKPDAQSNQREQNPGYIVEGGEVIKIVRMKREEIINCTCGVTEEDGLMIQCELCLCWQHAYCNNIERENQVPEKYICYICQNPVRQRSSKKYFHDQDWLKNGTLAIANYHCKDIEALKKRFEKLKKSHDLTGRLIELRNYMHSLKVKLKIADAKNHQKLYLWSQAWEKYPLPEKIDIKKEDPETKLKCNPENQTSRSDLDLLNNRNDPQNDSMLFSILKSAKEEQKFKEELSTFTKLDLNTFMDNNLEQLPIPAPQPEAAIESGGCRINLLEHIAHSQSLVEERLNDVEAQLELLDGRLSADDDHNRDCQTVQMLLRDLSTLKELSHSNSL